jgi:hypothetical protein
MMLVMKPWRDMTLAKRRCLRASQSMDIASPLTSSEAFASVNWWAVFSGKEVKKEWTWMDMIYILALDEGLGEGTFRVHEGE